MRFTPKQAQTDCERELAVEREKQRERERASESKRALAGSGLLASVRSLTKPGQRSSGDSLPTELERSGTPARTLKTHLSDTTAPNPIQPITLD